MAVNFNIGDTVVVNQAFVQNTLAARPATKERKALLEHLGRLGDSNLLIAKIYPIPLIRVTRIDTNSSKQLSFESESDLNNSFSFVSDFTMTANKVANVQNGSKAVIKKGSFVYLTGYTGTNPQKAVVASPKANVIADTPIFGIAIQDIFVNHTGNVLVEGTYKGLDTRSYSTQAECFIRIEDGQAISIPGGDFHKKGIVIDASPEGTVFLPRQPGGPYDCFEVRYPDGLCNNKTRHNRGRTGRNFIRVVPAKYADGKSAPMPNKAVPNARAISNTVFSRETEQPNALNATDYVWLWGQFVDHDIALTPTGADSYPITVPQDDQVFTPGAQLPFTRSEYDPATGTTNTRQQVNHQSSYLDASNVYGSTAERMALLRTNDGTGKLKTSAGNLLPHNSFLAENEPNNHDPLYYLAGDVRANENILLLAMHTLWVREHNRIATDIASKNSHLSGDQIFEGARRKVIALIQAITYNEFLPVLLGSGTISKYSGYDPTVNPEIANSFATAFYRLGHALVSSELKRLDANLNRITLGHTKLRDAFFRPDRLTEGGGIEPLLRGAAKQVCQSITTGTANELRNFLFGNQDLAARNIQRGRDHGLPALNICRTALGLTPHRSYSSITSDSDIKSRLVSIYTSMSDIDAWVGGLAEDNIAGALVGETIQASCKKQFEAIRDGDRFWYECVFAGDLLAEINSTKLSDVIRRNASIGNELQDNVFIL